MKQAPQKKELNMKPALSSLLSFIYATSLLWPATTIAVTLSETMAEDRADFIPSSGEFTELCESKDTPADIRKTIDVLVADANAKSCAEAEERLNRKSYFELINKGISSIYPLTLFPNISSIKVAKNKITSIAGIEKLTRISRLDIRDNLVKDISPINGLKQLRLFNAQNNKITSIGGLDDLPKIRSMNVNDNPITDLSDLAENDSIIGLFFAKTAKGGSSVGDLSPLSRLSALKGLTLKNNGNISNIASLKGIETLNVAGTGLKDLSEVSQITTLKRLEISDNPLSTADSIADLAKLDKLTTLNMFETGIADISVVGKLWELTYIDVSKNKIEDVSALKDLEKVTHFIFNDNPLGTTIKRTDDNCPKDAASEIIAEWCKWEGEKK